MGCLVPLGQVGPLLRAPVPTQPLSQSSVGRGPGPGACSRRTDPSSPTPPAEQRSQEPGGQGRVCAGYEVWPPLFSLSGWRRTGGPGPVCLSPRLEAGLQRRGLG